MQITFYRHGFACNSSSTHSLTWLREKPDNDESAEFGWDCFTCSDQEAKKVYFGEALFCSWTKLVNLSFTYGSHLLSDDVARFRKDMFVGWLAEECPYLLDSFVSARPNEGKEEWARDVYIDHQSVMAFPRYRIKPLLNTEFFNMFIPQVVEGNFVILGGNDNDDSVHPLLREDVTEEGKSIKLLYNTLQDQSSDEVMAEFDEKTGEFVISISRHGTLLRVKP